MENRKWPSFYFPFSTFSSRNHLPKLQLKRILSGRFIACRPTGVLEPVIGEGRLGGVRVVAELPAAEGKLHELIPGLHICTDSHPLHLQLQEGFDTFEHGLTHTGARNVVVPDGVVIVSRNLTRGTS